MGIKTTYHDRDKAEEQRKWNEFLADEKQEEKAFKKMDKAFKKLDTLLDKIENTPLTANDIKKAGKLKKVIEKNAQVNKYATKNDMDKLEDKLDKLISSTPDDKKPKFKKVLEKAGITKKETPHQDRLAAEGQRPNLER